MLQTERFNPKPGNPYRVIAVQDADHHANLRVTIAMSDGIARDMHILTVLGKTAKELGGIRPGDELIFGEHAALVRVARCNAAPESCINAKSQAVTDELTQQDMHRMALEHGAINALANAVASDPHTGKAKEIGEAMRAAIDALLGQKSKQECTCDTAKGEACSNCPPPQGATMSDKDIEQEIQAKGKTAARVTPADIEANIVGEHYFTAEHGARHPQATNTRDFGYVPSCLGLLTFCVLALRNGFTVTGESACASPENFDAEIGRNIARANAVQKIWPLMGYELRTQLARQVLTEGDAQADLDGTRRPDNHTD